MKENVDNEKGERETEKQDGGDDDKNSKISDDEEDEESEDEVQVEAGGNWDDE